MTGIFTSHLLTKPPQWATIIRRIFFNYKETSQRLICEQSHGWRFSSQDWIRAWIKDSHLPGTPSFCSYQRLPLYLKMKWWTWKSLTKPSQPSNISCQRHIWMSSERLVVSRKSKVQACYMPYIFQKTETFFLISSFIWLVRHNENITAYK